MEQVSKCCFRIKKGFVPNMKVSPLLQLERRERRERVFCTVCTCVATLVFCFSLPIG